VISCLFWQLKPELFHSILEYNFSIFLKRNTVKEYFFSFEIKSFSRPTLKWHKYSRILCKEAK